MGAKGEPARNLAPTVGSDAEALTFLPIIAADGTKLSPIFIVKGMEDNIKCQRLKVDSLH